MQGHRTRCCLPDKFQLSQTDTNRSSEHHASHPLVYETSKAALLTGLAGFPGPLGSVLSCNAGLDDFSSHLDLKWGGVLDSEKEISASHKVLSYVSIPSEQLEKTLGQRLNDADKASKNRARVSGMKWTHSETDPSYPGTEQAPNTHWAPPSLRSDLSLKVDRSFSAGKHASGQSHLDQHV